MSACTECGAVNGHLLGCSCDPYGAAISVARAVAASQATQWSPDDERFELKARLFAPALALAGCGLLALTGAGRFVLHVFFGMWLHEAGHALASWLCGIVAVPLPWMTMSVGGRSKLVGLALLVGLAVLGRRFVRQRRFGGLALCAGAGLAVLVLTFAVSFETARAFVTFWGDAGAMALGVLLLGCFFARRGSALHRGAVRWGLLTIGAAAYVDALATWLLAWRDRAAIPFGRIEGVGLSDPSRLVDQHGWTTRELVTRYLLVAALCFLAFTAVWVQAVRGQRERLRLAAGKRPDGAAVSAPP